MPKPRPVVTFDPVKNELNRLNHDGWTLDKAVGFKFETALVRPDESAAEDDGRYQALGKIGNRVVFLVFIPTEDGFQAISLRPAKQLERETWQIYHP